MTSDTPQHAIRTAIEKIATGPHLSKPLTRDEARAAFAAILSGHATPAQIGVFLIALRMKRETDDEFLGLLDALISETNPITVAVESLAILADPFDGFARSMPASPFLPAVLAACGLPTLAIGLPRLGPKYGVTHAQILSAAEIPVARTPQEAAAAVEHCGWSYCDQHQYAPRIAALVPLRNEIVKRTALNTLETLAKPLLGKRETHHLSGYVHSPYARLYALLARAAGFTSAAITKGVEGGFLPPLNKTSVVVRMPTEGDTTESIDPGALAIQHAVRAPEWPRAMPDPTDSPDWQRDAAHYAAQTGIAALQGAPGPTADALVYGAAIALWHTGKVGSLAEGAARARSVLRNGAAWDRWVAGKN